MSAEYKSIIDVAYRSILKRPVDDAGLAHFEQVFSQNGVEVGLGLMTRALLGSREYKKLASHAPDQLSELCASGSRTIDGKPAAAAVSIGSHCLAASLLNKYGFRRGAMPFDWLFSSPSILLHCLNDDFRTFLGREHYESVRERSLNTHAAANHKHYNPLAGGKIVFAHRNPTADVDYDYYVRTVDRFRAVLLSPDPVLFFLIARDDVDAVSGFGPVSDALLERKKNSALICVQLRAPSEPSNIQSLRESQRRGEHACYEYQPVSGESGKVFEEALDEIVLMRLVAQYQFQPPS